MILYFVENNKIIREEIAGEKLYDSILQTLYKTGEYLNIPKSANTNSQYYGYFEIIGVCYDCAYNNDANLEIPKTPSLYLKKVDYPFRVEG